MGGEGFLFPWVDSFYFSSFGEKKQGSISENIRNAFFGENIRNIFRAGLFKKKIEEIFLRENFEGWDQKVQSFIFGNIRDAFFWENIRIF